VEILLGETEHYWNLSVCIKYTLILSNTVLMWTRESAGRERAPPLGNWD